MGDIGYGRFSDICMEQYCTEAAVMKRILPLILVFCLSVSAMAALAEDEFTSYADDYPEAKAYQNVWVAEDGDWRIEAYAEDDGVRVMVVHVLGDNKQDIWEYATALNQARDALTAVPLGVHYQRDTATGAFIIDCYEDGDAAFTINENGNLLWHDLKEDAGRGLEFQKIGLFFGGRWMKGDIEVVFYAWYDGAYDIRLYQRGENNAILKDAILKGDYDPAADTVTAIGEFEGEDQFTVVFSQDESGCVVWTENGESTVLEYSYLTD